MDNAAIMISKQNHFFSYLKYLNNRRKKEVLYYKRFKELKKIIANNGLDTYFQPIVDLNSGKTFGFEALNRPVLSPLFPNTEAFYEFIGQTEQVFSFEIYCRNLSLKRFKERSAKEKKQEDIFLFLNIHPNVLLDSNYQSGETLQLLKELGIKPGQVIFELTEKSAVTDFNLFEKVLDNYRSQGFRIAIDDVGSGYNSLKTLIYLKPEFIKIDRSLIKDIHKNDEQKKLVSLLTDYAKQANTKVIAEGIESVRELAFIRRQGIHFGQGYALGKPKQELINGHFSEEFLE